MNHKLALINVLLGILCFENLTHALVEENVQERPCISPPPVVDPKFDYDWAMKQKNWYPLYGSKEGFYRTMKELVGNNATAFALLKEDVLEKSSCMTALWTDGQVQFSGLNGARNEFKVTSPSKGTFVYKPKTGDTGGYGEVTMIDMVKGYIFFAECWNGNQEGWNVMATSKKGLDKEAEDKIYAHAKSLGFQEKFFSKIDYSQCAKDQLPASSEEEDEMMPVAASSNINPYRMLAISDEESVDSHLMERVDFDSASSEYQD